MDLGSLAPKIIDAASDLASRVTPNFAWPVTDPIKAFFKNKFETKSRITMLEVIDVAKLKFAWKISDESCDILDLANGIRQAAIDGEVTLFGRRSKDCNFGSFIDYHPVVVVPMEHLRENDIDLISAPRRENVTMRTYRAGQCGTEFYCDLHLNRRQAFYWLRTTGREWRGRSDRRRAVSYSRTS